MKSVAKSAQSFREKTFWLFWTTGFFLFIASGRVSEFVFVLTLKNQNYQCTVTLYFVTDILKNVSLANSSSWKKLKDQVTVRRKLTKKFIWRGKLLNVKCSATSLEHSKDTWMFKMHSKGYRIELGWSPTYLNKFTFFTPLKLSFPCCQVVFAL